MTNAALKTAQTLGATRPQSDSTLNTEDHEGVDGSWLDEAEENSVSKQEIDELVSGALQDAMFAAAKPCPATYLDVLEGKKRDEMIARINDLPTVQLSHPYVQAEVFRQLAMIRAQGKLALGIVDSIRSYARSKQHAALAALT